MNIKPDKAQDPRPIVTITGAIMPEENTWKFPRSVSSKTKLAIEGPKTESNNTNDHNIELNNENIPNSSKPLR